jgi:hypothetical protein
MSEPKISEEKKQRFAAIYVLDHMINTPKTFPLFLERNDVDLEPILEHLLVKECIAIHDKERYVPTEKGREALRMFMARYSEFLRIFDVYCGVDLESGEFAFARYFEIENEQEWKKYLSHERWDDLRVAAAEFKKIDPVEIVFMSFINEGRFGRDETGWQFDLLLGSVWNEIAEIVDTAITVDDLGYADGDSSVSGSDVISDVLTQGAKLLTELLEEEESRSGGGSESGGGLASLPVADRDEQGYVEPVWIERYPPEYYQPYYDPFYVSPLWLAVFLF